MTSSVLDLPVIGKALKKAKRLTIKPAEAWNIWELADPMFPSPRRPLTGGDATGEAASTIRRTVRLHLRYQRKPRFATKLTGWSRIGYLDRIFPDSLFIHILRDGRAVASPLMKVDWWLGWEGPEKWRWGELPQKYAIEWEESCRSPVVLAAIQWKIVVEEIRGVCIIACK